MAISLAEMVADRYNLALSAHGDLCVDQQGFADHLLCIASRHLGRGASNETIVNFIGILHTDDLLLSFACAQRHEAAWRRFHALYQKYLSDLCHYLFGVGSFGREFGESFWIELFLPDRSGKSRIASYDGRSSMATWLRVIVSNRIINERQRKASAFSNLEGIPEPADPMALHNVEMRLREGRYESLISQCLERASCQLTEHERLIVLLRYDQDLQLGEIARLFSVHQSTITRQLERMMNRLRANIISFLSSECGLGHAAIEECLSVAANSFTSVSMLGLLKDLGPANGNRLQRRPRLRVPQGQDSDYVLARAAGSR